MTDFPLPLPWIQLCLEETDWISWRVEQFLGIGMWSMAVSLNKGGRNAVLLVNRPDSPQVKPGIGGVLDLYQSAASIRVNCRKVGMPVAKTIGSPRAWSGGAAVLLSRVPGRDMEHMLDQELDAYRIGCAVAEMVLSSQVLGAAHKKHHSAFGVHIFGKPGKHSCPTDAWAMCISPLGGIDPQAYELIEQLKVKAHLLLDDIPKTTQIWDVGNRNIMLGEDGTVVGLVDQVDMFTGDAMFVPGFSLAMLGDVHHWKGVRDYAKAWKQAWGITPEQWQRVRLHRLGCYGRFIGKSWQAQDKDRQRLADWKDKARIFLDQC